MAKKKQVNVADEKFIRDAANLGGVLVKLGLMPDLSKSTIFKRNFNDKIYRNIEHLFDNHAETETHHPYHHLYLAETILKLGYFVYGKAFEENFRDEIGFYRTLFKDYMSSHAKMYQKYEQFKAKESLDEKVRVIRAHDPKGLLKVRKPDLRKIRNGVYEVNHCCGLNKTELNKGEKSTYRKIMGVKDQFFELAAMFKGAFSN